ncbi:hypothetical protein [Zoogloea oryzae]|uniref:hypothetical protein n=1 Tax=Zoogloea oryzae TaxID=310767 RepID=UPI0024E13671|nr:hypothetical protein [Zoogloea oryzae]
MNDLHFSVLDTAEAGTGPRRVEKIGDQTAIYGPPRRDYLSKTLNIVHLNSLSNPFAIFTSAKNHKPLSPVKKSDKPT